MIKPPGRQLIGHRAFGAYKWRATLVKNDEPDENARNEEAKGAILQRKRRPLHREERERERERKRVIVFESPDLLVRHAGRAR